MSRSDLALHWEMRGRDWITSIATSHDGHICIGSRDGEILLLDALGNVLARAHAGSWVGAAAFADLRDERWGPAKGLFVLIGTKAGDFVAYELVPSQSGTRMEERYRATANNTVRSIAVWSSPTAKRAVAVYGSEDRHVYAVSMESGFHHAADFEVNGWIRCVAFAGAEPLTHDTTPVILSGCGDKNVYIHMLDGEHVGQVFVDAKVHALYGSPPRNDVYGVSDGKRFHAIRLTANPSQQWSIPLPHRATHLVPLNQPGRLLASAEDLRMYVVDTRDRTVKAYFDVGQRVFALATCNLHGTDLLLLGGHGRMTANIYEVKEEVPPPPPEGVPGEVGLPLVDSAALAEASAFGVKSSRVQVGIGRFLFIVQRTVGHPAVALVASDEGFITVVGADDGELRLLGRSERLGTARAWSVEGSWTDDGVLSVLAATSDRRVERLRFDNDEDGVLKAIMEEPVELRDWPREIRPMVDNDGRATGVSVAWCENGDVVLLNDRRETLLETGDTLRSGFAEKTEDGRTIILTGSDQNTIRCYRDGESTWAVKATDRVREVQLHNGKAIAVSEDRHLYVLNLDGDLQWRYRFPHRALCVEPSLDFQRDLEYLVGCGDGRVYGVNEKGFITSEYWFPDRIRDVRHLDSRTMLVACEDGHLYSAVPASMIGHGLSPLEMPLLDELINSVRQRATGAGGLAAVQQLSFQERLLLISTVEAWFLESVDTPLFVALIDRLIAQLRTHEGLRAFYALAKALVYLMSHISFKAGQSRVLRMLSDSNTSTYMSHALLSSIVECSVSDVVNVEDGITGIDVIDTIVSTVALDEDWIRAEAIRHLGTVRFFDLRAGGFLEQLRTSGMPASRYRRLVDLSGAAGPDQSRGAEQSDVRALLRVLQDLPKLSSSDLTAAFDARADLDPRVLDLLGVLHDLLFGLEDPSARLRAFLRATQVTMQTDGGRQVAERASEAARSCQVAPSLSLVSAVLRAELDSGEQAVLSPLDFLISEVLISGLEAFAASSADVKIDLR